MHGHMHAVICMVGPGSHACRQVIRPATCMVSPGSYFDFIQHARLTGDLSTNKKHAIYIASYKLSYHPEIITKISVAAVPMH